MGLGEVAGGGGLFLDTMVGDDYGVMGVWYMYN